MRHILSTALVAVMVGSLAGVTAGTLAQPEPDTERTVSPAATAANADKVDGRHAVKYTSKRGLRAGKLVATNYQGFLPSNIVKPFWGNIRNKPAGFADGVDNAGVTNVKLTYVEAKTTLAAGEAKAITAWCPKGSWATGGGWYSSGWGFEMTRSQPYNDLSGWAAGGRNTAGSSIDIIAMAVCMSTTPSGALSIATR